MRTTLDTEIRAELRSIAERCGCELIHIDFVAGALRLILDSPDGVTLEHCEKVSREASAVLDVCDFGSGRYTLEVSSPGLDRELYRDDDYERFSGSHVKVTWRDPSSASKRTDTGILSQVHRSGGDKTSIELAVGEQQLTIKMADIIKARLDPEL